jgi:hypothetical protein
MGIIQAVREWWNPELRVAREAAEREHNEWLEQHFNEWRRELAEAYSAKCSVERQNRAAARPAASNVRASRPVDDAQATWPIGQPWDASGYMGTTISTQPASSAFDGFGGGSSGGGGASDSYSGDSGSSYDSGGSSDSGGGSDSGGSD